MPAPSAIDKLLDLAHKSGVLTEEQVDAYVRELLAAPTVPDTPAKLAAAMVRDGLLTHFQAEHLLVGKSRRFIVGKKYRLLERLGAGGMGSVYLCDHVFLRRRVAVKVLPPGRSDDRSALERFYREARAVAALDHPNIVRCHDIDCDGAIHFLVMEYVDGSSLQEIVKKHGPMDITRAAHYIRQAALGLQHAHEAGLVHRDVKPGNLLVDRTGTVKVLDLGLARFFNDASDDITRKHDETVLGTTDYLAPEQALDGNVDIRADIYSLGATFYFLLAGKPPFADGSIAQKLIWHQTRQPKPIRSVRAEVPEALAAVLERLMAKDATKRYQTPAEVALALAAWTQTPITPPPDAEMPHLCPAALRGQSRVVEPPSSPPSPGKTAAAVGTATPAATSPQAYPKTPRVRPRGKPTEVAGGTPQPAQPAGKSPPPRPAAPRRRAGNRGTQQAAPEVELAPAAARQSQEQSVVDTDNPTARVDTDPVVSRRRPASPSRPGTRKTVTAAPHRRRRRWWTILAAPLTALGQLFGRSR
ncbi:MAG TPA: protein kinase [Gemmataceae bacterium]|jgi:serine/threonine protein kinase|nr:protein kinase [Gemmataceae bacterium]